jgi:hypothetical protein
VRGECPRVPAALRLGSGLPRRFRTGAPVGIYSVVLWGCHPAERVTRDPAVLLREREIAHDMADQHQLKHCADGRWPRNNTERKSNKVAQKCGNRRAKSG